MIGKLILLVLVAFALSASATRLKVQNFCQKKIHVVEKALDNSVTPICILGGGFYCYKDYTLVNARIQDGSHGEATYVKLNVNNTGIDQYYIGTDKGFDHSIQVGSNQEGSILLTCEGDKNCSDAYNNDGSKIGIVASNGVITINFCPENEQPDLLTANGLQLVESIQNPEKYAFKQPIRAEKHLFETVKNKQ